MKKIITILMLFFTITTYSKESNIVTETITSVSNKIDTLKTNAINTAKAIDTSSVSKQLYTDLKSGLVGIAGALKVGAEHVYEVLVKQQVVKSITELFAWFIIPLILTILALRLTNKAKLLNKEVVDDTEGFSIFGAVILIGIPLLITILTPNWNTIVTGFINPEFGALEQIMDWVKEKK